MKIKLNFLSKFVMFLLLFTSTVFSQSITNTLGTGGMVVSTFIARWGEVSRGYVLHITNLEEKEFEYLVEFWTTPPNDEPRWASGLNDYFSTHFPIGGSTGNFIRKDNVYVKSMHFKIPAGVTVTVALHPREWKRIGEEGAPLQVEGYVTLRLPKTKVEGSKFRLFPQNDKPVKVLLNPETAMFKKSTQGPGAVRNKDGIVTGFISMVRIDLEGTEPLIVSTGKAENELEPDGLRLLGVTNFIYTLGAALGTKDEERMGALVELISQVDANELVLGEVNKVLFDLASKVKQQHMEY